MNLHELLDLYIGIVIANVVLVFILAFLEYWQSTYYKPFIVRTGDVIFLHGINFIRAHRNDCDRLVCS